MILTVTDLERCNDYMLRAINYLKDLNSLEITGYDYTHSHKALAFTERSIKNGIKDELKEMDENLLELDKQIKIMNGNINLEEKC